MSLLNRSRSSGCPRRRDDLDARRAHPPAETDADGLILGDAHRPADPGKAARQVHLDLRLRTVAALVVFRRGRDRIGAHANDFISRLPGQFAMNLLAVRVCHAQMLQRVARRDAIVELQLQDISIVLRGLRLPCPLQLERRAANRVHARLRQAGAGGAAQQGRCQRKRHARRPRQIAVGRKAERPRIVPFPVPRHRGRDRPRLSVIDRCRDHVRAEMPAKLFPRPDDRPVARLERIHAQRPPMPPGKEAVIPRPRPNIQNGKAKNCNPETPACRPR